MSHNPPHNLILLGKALDDQINLNIDLAIVNTLIKTRIDLLALNESGVDVPCPAGAVANDHSTDEPNHFEGVNIDGITVLRILEVVGEILKRQGSEIAVVKAESRSLGEAARSFGATLVETQQNLDILKEDYGKLLHYLKKCEELLSKQQRLLGACTCRPKPVN